MRPFAFLIVALCLGFGLGCENDPTEGRNPGECSDGADNDGDGAFDCNDSDCAGARVCQGGVMDTGGNPPPGQTDSGVNRDTGTPDAGTPDTGTPDVGRRPPSDTGTSDVNEPPPPPCPTAEVCWGDFDVLSGADLPALQNCGTITGNLTIGRDGGSPGASVQNLELLECLTEVQGDLSIFFHVGGLDGLKHLQSVGGKMQIIQSDSLTRLNGLQNLTAIGGDLKIISCPSLNGFDGLSGLISIGGSMRISGNEALTSLYGLESLQTIGGDLFIDANGALTNLQGLSNLQGNVESIILEGSSLQNVDGLNGLDSIGSGASSNAISQIRITETQIPNLNAFRDIEISGMTGLDLEENARLTDVSGLNRFAFQPGQNFIHINDNVRLCDETIYDFLYGSNWNGRYVNNGNPSYPDVRIRGNGKIWAMCPNNRPKVTFDLRWDSDHNDLNLHLKKINTGRTSDGYCGPHESCFWANCTTYDWQNRNWDFSDGSDGDPRMTADENCGFGPETIVIENIFYGDYKLGVQLWDLSWCPRTCPWSVSRTQCLAYAPDCAWSQNANGCVHAFAASTATVGIYVNGVLQEEYSRLMSADNDFWEVAEIRYRDGNRVDILPQNTYWNNWSCQSN